MNPLWEGQEATAFPDNWSIGLSFFHNVFAREHNTFVDYFRSQDPKEDSGLRRPDKPKDVVPFAEVTPRELFEIARLVVSAEIAKIHTIEWTTQLLYDEALHRGMNANWSGLFEKYPVVGAAVETVMDRLKKSGDLTDANLKYSAFAGGPGIFGMRNEIRDCWHFFFCPNTYTFPKPDHINGGTHHFGSPFNFPEEFITVYRLHPMVPDLIEYRQFQKPNHIAETIPVVETFRKRATTTMHDKGLANLALSMGRQRLGRLTLLNHPQFLQNLHIDEAVVTVEMRDDLRQPSGVLHGGVTATLIDTAMAFAVRTRLEKDEATATIDLTVHYLRPHVEGTLTCTARVVRAGKRIFTVAADVENEHGKLIATAVSTYTRV